jgi:hypothetical protein
MLFLKGIFKFFTTKVIIKIPLIIYFYLFLYIISIIIYRPSRKFVKNLLILI